MSRALVLRNPLVNKGKAGPTSQKKLNYFKTIYPSFDKGIERFKEWKLKRALTVAYMYPTKRKARKVEKLASQIKLYQKNPEALELLKQDIISEKINNKRSRGFFNFMRFSLMWLGGNLAGITSAGILRDFLNTSLLETQAIGVSLAVLTTVIIHSVFASFNRQDAKTTLDAIKDVYEKKGEKL